MSVTINILHLSLRQLADNHSVVQTEGKTIGECLDDLIKQFPEIQRGLFDREGRLLAYVYFYVNGKGAYPTNLSEPIKDGDELTISLLLAGG